jgi:hypothetical protein
MKSIYLLFLSTLLTLTSFAHNEPWTASRPDGHAPITVMGDHMHAMGEWMVSYRYMTMDMEGLMKGSDSVQPTMGDTGFMMTGMLPKDMTMDMHMFGAMHAISDQWTLMCMLNYLDNEMTMQNGDKMETSGLGDLKIGGLYDLARWEDGRRAHLSLGLSAPTGSIDEKNADGNFSGYGMQLGSGTWDFTPAITYLGQTENYSYGAQLGGVLRIGDNDQGYTLGNRVDATVWGARKITDSLSASVKIDHTCQEEVDGSHKGIPVGRRNMSPSNHPDHQGRDLTSVGLGLNYYFQSGALKGHRIAAEWETPIHQKVNGVQLELDSSWTLGWQYAW